MKVLLGLLRLMTGALLAIVALAAIPLGVVVVSALTLFDGARAYYIRNYRPDLQEREAAAVKEATRLIQVALLLDGGASPTTPDALHEACQGDRGATEHFIEEAVAERWLLPNGAGEYLITPEGRQYGRALRSWLKV